MTFFSPALKDALSELGIIAGEVPAFGEAGHVEPIQVELTFMWPQPNQKDLDNMIKFVLDAYEGILYPNDKKIIKLLPRRPTVFCCGCRLHSP
jgi:Holliday junction resolvase RusA-like endonuclease